MPINAETWSRLKEIPVKQREGGKKVDWDKVKSMLKELQEKKGEMAHTVDEVKAIAEQNLMNGAEEISRMRVRGFLEKECTKKRAECLFDGVRKYYRIR